MLLNLPGHCCSNVVPGLAPILLRICSGITSLPKASISEFCKLPLTVSDAKNELISSQAPPLPNKLPLPSTVFEKIVKSLPKDLPFLIFKLFH